MVIQFTSSCELSLVPAKLNGSLISIAMKEVVSRAMRQAQIGRFTFAPTQNRVTHVDPETQQSSLEFLKELFPGFGIMTEKGDLNVPCRYPDVDVYFTFNPIDGTSAFTQKESQWLSTMLSLVLNGCVIAVCIGEVLTGELYYYRPDSQKTHRLDLFGHELLSIDSNKPLSEQYLHLREPPHWSGYHPIIRQIAISHTGLFKSVEVGGESIGLSMSRLWKANVGGCVVHRRTITPWDETPIIGMNERLGFISLQPESQKSLRLVQIANEPCKYVRNVGGVPDMLILHRSRIPELKRWCSQQNITLGLLPGF